MSNEQHTKYWQEVKAHALALMQCATDNLKRLEAETSGPRKGLTNEEEAAIVSRRRKTAFKTKS